MNKYIIGGIGIVALVCLVLLTIEIIPKKNDSKKELELTYEINAGIPFKWIYEIEDPSVVEFVKSYVVRDDNTDGKVGASVYTNYVFKGLKEGNTTITFKEISIDNRSDIIKEEKNNIKVDSELNIILVK